MFRPSRRRRVFRVAPTAQSPARPPTRRISRARRRRKSRARALPRGLYSNTAPGRRPERRKSAALLTETRRSIPVPVLCFSPARFLFLRRRGRRRPSRGSGPRSPPTGAVSAIRRESRRTRTPGNTSPGPRARLSRRRRAHVASPRRWTPRASRRDATERRRRRPPRRVRTSPTRRFVSIRRRRPPRSSARMPRSSCSGRSW